MIEKVSVVFFDIKGREIMRDTLMTSNVTFESVSKAIWDQCKEVGLSTYSPGNAHYVVFEFRGKSGLYQL